MNKKNDKNYMRRTHLILAVALLWLSSAAAQPSADPAAARQITTHPAADLEPRLSPDGEWLAYASNRSGNYDIWIKNIHTGRTRQLTKHRSDDFHPVWDKKNRYIIFVSQRSDAKGDLFRLNLRSVLGELIVKGAPERLTTYMGFDGYPTLSEFDEHIAWVSDRTGRPEIWLQTKRRQDVRQLTHGGATHPAWSPKQGFLAFTSFRDDSCNGDIWIINLYAPKELFEVKTATDSLERPMWPITSGPDADGFPIWAPDANSLVFVRSDMDTDGDGLLTPADKSTLWSVDVLHAPGDGRQTGGLSYEIFRNSFNDRIATNARPLTSAHLQAVEPDYSADSDIYYASDIKGNYDIWSMPSPTKAADAEGKPETVAQIDKTEPLPQDLHGQELSRLVHYAENDTTNSEETNSLWRRISALQAVTDNTSTPDAEKWQAAYGLGVCYYLLGYAQRAGDYFSFLKQQAPESEAAVWAETMLSIMEHSNSAAAAAEHRAALFESVNAIRDKHPDNTAYQAKSTLLIADMWQEVDADSAEYYYRRVDRLFPGYDDIRAHSLYNLGLLYIKQEHYPHALQTFLTVLQNYYQQQEWALKARDEIVNLFVRDTHSSDELVARYKMLYAQFSQFDLIAVEPLMRAAAVTAQKGDFDAAIGLYDFVIAQYPNLEEQNFQAKMARIDLIIQKGEIVQAAAELERLRTDYEKSNAVFAQDATDKLALLLLNSADELAASKNYELAAARYKSVLRLASRNLRAHQGYIRSLAAIGKVDKALKEYSIELEMHPNNNVLHYTIGLCYSYKGAQLVDGKIDPATVNNRFLKLSNDMLQRALEYNYNLIDAYLTLSFNYEMLENDQRWEKAAPKSFWRKAGGTLSSPFIWLYQTATFYNETKAPRYYESAIEELTKALALNDENEQPRMESMLARNMANNYYNLGEFGFNKAYEFYHLSLKYDSAFVDENEEAVIYERMGHCAMFVNDQMNGPGYLKRAIRLFRDLKDENRVLINTKRLALLYEIGDNSADALAYYKQAADMEDARHFYDGLMRSYRSIAFHSFVLHKPQQATAYADSALELMDSGKVTRSYGKPIYLQFGVLGLYAPFPYDLRKFGAKSSFQLSTDEEEAFIYSIFARNYLDENNYDSSIVYIKKKFAIYEQRHDYDALAIFQNNMGQIYYTKGDYDLAWRWFTNAYWMCRKTKYMGGQLLNITNAAYVVLTIANDPDPARHENLLKYYNWITNKIRELLELTHEDEISFAFYHTQLNLLLGELTLIDPEHENAAEQFPATAHRLQAAATADSLYRQALDISQRYKYSLEESSIHFRLGTLHAFLGEYAGAIDEFEQSRDMALQHKIPELAWQAIYAIGTMVEAHEQEGGAETVARYKPLESYQQAIRISESNRAHHPGVTASRMRELYRGPYDKAAARLADLGRPLEALQMNERLRERIFLETLEPDNLTLFSARHQILFHRADSLQKEINKNAFALLQTAGEQTAASKSTTPSAQHVSLQTQYEQTLSDIRSEAPEIESLIKITPVPLSALQQQLPPNTQVVYQIADEHNCLLAVISTDSVSFVAIRIDRDALQTQLDKAVRAIRQQQSPDLTGAPAQLLAGIEAATQAANIIFIPDPDFLLYPWSALGEIATDASLKILSVSSSLTSLAHSLRAIKPHGRGIFVAGDSAHISALKLQGYEIKSAAAGQVGDAFGAQRRLLAAADIIHLGVTTDWNPAWPSRSTFGFAVDNSTPAKISAGALYNYNMTTAYLVNLDILDADLCVKQPEPLMAWERALAYTGVPSLMLPLWTTADSSLDYYNQFYKNLLTDSPAAARTKTDSLFRAQNKLLKSYAAYQIYGAPGMGTAAVRDSVTDVHDLAAKAERAAYNRDWSRAIEICRQALGDNKSTQTDRDTLNAMLFEAAVNDGKWDVAIPVQRTRTAALLRRNNYQQAADAYSLLALLYVQAGDENRRIRTNKSLDDLKRRFGVHNDPIDAYRRLALILRRGENFARAQGLLQQAAQRCTETRQTKQRCLSLQRAADILDVDLHNSVAALSRLDEALTALPDSGDNDLRAELLVHKSEIYSRLLILPRAYSSVQKADSLCRASGDSSRRARCQLQRASVLFQKRELKLALDQCDALLKLQRTDAEIKIKSLMLKSKIFAERHNEGGAEKTAQRAYRLARESGDAGLTTLSRDHLALILWMQKDHHKAAGLLQNSLAQTKSSKRERLRSTMLLGALLLDAGDAAAARNSLETARTLSGDLNDLFAQATARLLLSHCQSETSRALEEADAAIALAETARLHDLLWRAHLQKATLLADNGRNDAAHSEFATALAQLDAADMAPAFYHFQAGLSTDENDFFAAFTSFLIKANLPQEALGVIGKQKQRAYRYFVADRLESIPAQYDDWAATYDSLRAERALARAQAAAQWSSKKADAPVADRLQKNEKSIEAFRSRLLISAPLLYQRYFDGTIDIEALQRTLPDSSGVVAYYSANDVLYTWLIDAGGVEFKQSQTSREQIDNSTRQLRELLQRQQPTNRPATELYKLLITPWEHKLANWTQIVVIADKALRDVPFAVLQSDSAKYLGLEHDISYALQLTSQNDLSQPNADSLSAAAFCAPATEAEKTPSYAALLGSSLGRYFNKSHFYNADHPLSEQLSDAASHYAVLYWGGTWERDDSFPFQSALRRASDNSTLNCRDILATFWTADLAVIYATSSQENSVAAGDPGLAECFLKNGARFLLAPAWPPTDDLTSAVLLKRFFRNVAAGQTPTQALHQAQQWVHDTINPQPAFWAGWRLWQNL